MVSHERHRWLYQKVEECERLQAENAQLRPSLQAKDHEIRQLRSDLAQARSWRGPVFNNGLCAGVCVSVVGAIAVTYFVSGLL